MPPKRTSKPAKSVSSKGSNPADGSVPPLTTRGRAKKAQSLDGAQIPLTEEEAAPVVARKRYSIFLKIQQTY